MNTCHICGYPIPPPNQAYGYVGPVCMGHTYQMPYYTTPLTAERAGAELPTLRADWRQQ